MTRSLRLVHIVLSLGLILILERLRLDPRWRYAVWAVIALNEVRGIIVVYYTGDAALAAAWGTA